MEISDKLVVRTYAPARRWIVLAIVVLLAGLALYVMFELGRYKAGYDALQAAAQRDGLQQQIDQLERTQRELRVQLAAAEEARIGEGRERAEVARTIGELQAQVARDQQEMGFYRGLVAQPGQPAADAVRVQQFRILKLPGDQHYRAALHVEPAAATGGVRQWHVGDDRGRHARGRRGQRRSGGSDRR